jgi:AhpC/TSA family
LKRRWNIMLWTGFAIVVLSVISYVPVFALFPVTRDVPWVNYLLFVAGGVLLAVGLKRAYGEPDRYRGKISGPILSVQSMLIAGLFIFGVLFLTKQLPASSEAPRVGQPAPQFTLANIDGKQTALADLLNGRRGVVLIFYRGYW